MADDRDHAGAEQYAIGRLCSLGGAEVVLDDQVDGTAMTSTGTRMHILMVIEHTSHRIRVLGATARPTAAWLAQVAATRRWTWMTRAAKSSA